MAPVPSKEQWTMSWGHVIERALTRQDVTMMLRTVEKHHMPRCIDAARSRARDAGVDKLCSWLRCDMLRLPQADSPHILLWNRVRCSNVLSFFNAFAELPNSLNQSEYVQNGRRCNKDIG